MRISGEGKIGITLGLLGLLGGGSMMVWPHHTEIGWVLIAIATGGLFFLAAQHCEFGKIAWWPAQRHKRRILALGWTAEWRFVDLGTAIRAVARRTRVADMAFIDDIQATEQMKFLYVWKLLKNLATAKIIDLHCLENTLLGGLNFKVINEQELQDTEVDVDWISLAALRNRQSSKLYSVVKISPEDLEKAIIQISAEIKIATRSLN